MHVKNICLIKLRTGKASGQQLKDEGYHGYYFHKYFEHDWEVLIEDYGINREPVPSPSGWRFVHSGTFMYNFAYDTELEEEHHLPILSDEEAFFIFMSWQKKRAKLFMDAICEIEKEVKFETRII